MEGQQNGAHLKKKLEELKKEEEDVNQNMSALESKLGLDNSKKIVRII